MKVIIKKSTNPKKKYMAIFYNDNKKYVINPNLEDYDNNTLVFRHESFTPYQLDILKSKAFKEF